MKLLFPLLALLLAGCFTPSAARYGYSTPSASISVDTFGPYLDPYGAWMDYPGYGRVWQPSPQYVGSDFYPYGSGGRWVSTNAGWVFDSEYPFGWAVFHYGRWFRDTNYGWMWMPGRSWAPSWVSWRSGGQYVGWAPLGPRGRTRYDWNDWNFVPANRFTVHNSRAYGFRDRDFHRAVAVTAPVRGRQNGPPREWVSRQTQSEIVSVPVNQVPSAGRFVPPPPGRTERTERRGRSAPPAYRYEAPQQQQQYDQRLPPPPPPPASSSPGWNQPRNQQRRYESPAAPPPQRYERRQDGYSAPPPPPSSSGSSRRMMRPPPPPPRR